jgi:hypothetical protein
LTNFCKKKELQVVRGDFLTFKYNYNDSEVKNTLRKNKIIQTYIYLYKKYKQLQETNYNYPFSFAETIAFNAFQLDKKKESLYWQGKAINNNFTNLKAYLKFFRYLIF